MSRTPQPPSDDLRFRALEQRLERLERAQPSSIAFKDAAGTLRVRLGEQTDGKYGLRVWDAAGALVIDSTT
jgi:hypothetical protein